mgnify:CR=1 FL=1
MGREPTTIGRYRLHEEVGRGGAGVVFRAEDPLGRVVALKLLQAAASEPQRRRFQAEVRALLRIRHPHVVGLLDAGTSGGVPFLVMEWVEGETLAARLEREGPLPPREAAELCERLAQAMARCHQEGVLHRDIKPGNVLLRRSDGAPLLADFGLAKQELLDGASRDSIGARTAEGAPLGTPGFWAPEQARGELERVGPPADVYALGATLYAALTARSPYQGRDLIGLYQAMEERPPPPSSLSPRTPSALDAICLCCLEPDPDRRYSHAGALAEALRAFTVKGPAAAPRPRTRGLIALVLSALALTAAGVWRVRSPAPPESPLRAEPGPSPPSSATGPAPLEPLPEVDEVRRAAADAEYHRAYELSQAGERGRALSALDHALELDPTRADAWSSRAMLRHQEGDRQGAEEDLERALGLDPRLAHVWRNRGLVRAERGALREALEDFTRALELAPREARTLRDRALVRARLNDVRGSQADLDAALALSPGDPDLLFNRGVARSMGGDLPGALADMQAAEAGGFPERTRLLTARAQVRLGLGDEAGALADCDAAAAEAPATLELLRTRAATHLRMKRPARALADLEAARALAPDDPGLAELELRALLTLGRFRAAREAAEAQLARAPLDAFAWYGLGAASFMLRQREPGARERAREALARFLELAPDHGEAGQAREALANLEAGR